MYVWLCGPQPTISVKFNTKKEVRHSVYTQQWVEQNSNLIPSDITIVRVSTEFLYVCLLTSTWGPSLLGILPSCDTGKSLRGWVQFSNQIFSFLFCCILFAAKYTSVLTHLQHFGVGVFAWWTYQVCKVHGRSAVTGKKLRRLWRIVLIYIYFISSG